MGKEKQVPVIEIGKGKGEGSVDIVHVVVGEENTTPQHCRTPHHMDRALWGEGKWTGD